MNEPALKNKITAQRHPELVSGSLDLTGAGDSEINSE